MRILLLALPLLLCGCVERALVIESEPPGAEVWMDGEKAGTTPIRIPFVHYGGREITLTKGGYALEKGVHPVKPPWYERFPIDFLTENLWPWTLVDERKFSFALKPEKVGSDEVYARAKAMREETAKPPEKKGP